MAVHIGTLQLQTPLGTTPFSPWELQKSLGKNSTWFWLSESPVPSAPAPDFADNIHSPQAVCNLCHTVTEQTNPFTKHPPLSQRQARLVQAQLQKAGCWVAGIPQTRIWRCCCASADNPGTESYAFTQMLSPPHSSHLPRSSSTSRSSPGFPHPQAHSSGVFCTDFLSLLSRD